MNAGFDRWVAGMVLILLGVSATGWAQSRPRAKILNKDLQVKIVRLDNLNSGKRETNISITPNGTTMYFMSDRGGQPWSTISSFTFEGTVRYDGDIWYSHKSGSSWSPARCMKMPINSENGEDEPNISPDGRHMVYQSWRGAWERMGGPYYEVERNGNYWGIPRGLGGGITRFFDEKSRFYKRYATDGASMSPDGKRFIVACGPDYDGNLDLFMSERDASGRWSTPRKLPLSTPRDERSVFFGSDSRTLYFSSNGYGGHGGLDIFKTTINEDGSIGAVINLGPPFNTASNDYGFIMTATGEEAYFVREGDIYQARIENPPAEILPEATGMVKGLVSDDKGQPVDAKLILLDAASGRPVMRTTTDPTTGKYGLHVTNARKKYVVLATVSGDDIGRKPVAFDATKSYAEVTVNFTLSPPEPEPAAPEEPEVAVETNTTVTPPEPTASGPSMQLGQEEAEPTGSSIPLSDSEVHQYIHFSYGSPRLAMKDRLDLNDLVDKLKRQPELAVVVTGFPDDRGEPDFNRTLAAKRARSVRDYITKQGIPKDRVIAQYFAKAYSYHANKSSQHLGIRKVEIVLITGRTPPVSEASRLEGS